MAQLGDIAPAPAGPNFTDRADGADFTLLPAEPEAPTRASRFSGLTAMNPGQPPGSIGTMTHQLAAQYGVNPDSYGRLVMIESAGDPTAHNEGTDARGLTQLTPPIRAKFGAGDGFNAQTNLRAGLDFITGDVLPSLSAATGIPQNELTAVHVYLSHQQGATGGPLLINAANADDPRPAWQVLQEGVNDLRREWGKPLMTAEQAQATIRRNLPPEVRDQTATITAGDYVDIWTQKFGEPAASTPFLAQGTNAGV